MKSSESSAKSDNNNAGANNAFDAIRKITEATLEKVSPKWQPVIFVMAVLMVTAIAIAGIVATVNNPVIVAIIAILSLIFLAFIGFVIWVAVMRDPQARPIWEKSVLNEEIPDLSIGELAQNLKEIVAFSVDYLKNQGIAIESENMPANLFYPHYSHPHENDGLAFWLAMNDRLAQGMTDDQVENLRISPGRGASGTVFKHGEDGVYKRGANLDPDFVERYVPKNLKWIVSTAIKRKGQIVAVLNVEVRDIDVLPNVLKDLQEALKKSNCFEDLTKTFADLHQVILIVKISDNSRQT